MSAGSRPESADEPLEALALTLEEGVDASDIVRVVRGDPDEEELAALVAGIIAAAAALAEEEPEHVDLPPWTDHGRRLGAGLHPGPTSWRWSMHRLP